MKLHFTVRWRAISSLLFAFVLFVAHQFKRIGNSFLFLSLSMSALTFWLYFLDKHFAQRGKRRIPEINLHIFAIAGGWPGAFLAQDILHHKTRKIAFFLSNFIAVASSIVVIYVIL